MIKATNHSTEGAGRAAARLARQVAHSLDGADLSLAQYRVLTFLTHQDSAPASAIAGRLRVTKPSMTAMIDLLVERGFVERQPDPNDRRRRPLTITDAGRAHLARADKAVEERLREVAAYLPDPEAALGWLAQWNDAITSHQLDRLAGGPES